MKNKYYCDKVGHTEYIYNRYCIKCNDYLCPKCKCGHNKEEKYLFDEKENIQKIFDVEENLKNAKTL